MARKKLPAPPADRLHDPLYAAVWSVVAHQIAETFERHTNYLTQAGRQSAAVSLNKRITGVICGELRRSSTLQTAVRAVLTKEQDRKRAV